jgi:acetyl esterase/lipase
MAGAAVVYVHGGAFAAGGLASRPELFEALTARGITVVDVEYRLAPPPRWSDAPADVLCALAWLRESAGSLGVDPARVIVMGESAGGSLALVAGYAAGTPSLQPSCEGDPLVPAGIVAVSPAADLAGIWADGTLTVDGRPFPEAYVGGSPATYPERYEAASPFRLLRVDLPPTLIVTGANDHLVLPARVTGLADRIGAAGADCRLVVVPFADHGFDGPPNGFGAQLLEGLVPAFFAELTAEG